MDRQDEVRISFDTALELAQFLEQLTGSLDRIGSRAADGLDGAAMAWSFILDANVAPRASRLRRPLWGAIAQVLGEEAMYAIAEDVVTYPEVGGPDPEIKSSRGVAYPPE